MKFKIPKRFKVGTVDYTVNTVERCGDNEDFGRWLPFGIIEIARQSCGYPVSESRKKQVFLHELTHAILGQMNKEDLNSDESFVNTFSSFLAEAIDSMEGEL